MVEEDQSDVIDFLVSKQFDSHPLHTIKQRQTHISHVILRGPRAWKLKRAIRFPYADFSSPEKRLAACKQEIELNRRSAPSLYIAAHRITQEPDGRLALDGQGHLVDAVVEMQRFDEAGLFTELARKDQLTFPLLTGLAQHIAGFHNNAAIAPHKRGAAHMASVLQLNEQSPAIARVFGKQAAAQLHESLRQGWKQHAAALDRRAAQGSIRHCHGDLHLGNICLVDRQATLFDCIEFNEELATIDVLYDLAFLLMDLWHQARYIEANWVMNRYLDVRDDVQDLSVLSWFMALRASIRAQVLASSLLTPDVQQPSVAYTDTLNQAHAYLRLSHQLLQGGHQRLVAIGGFSGTGKSTVATHVAHTIGPAPGARVLATDRIRKHLAQVDAYATLGPEHYTSQASETVYQTVYKQTKRLLRDGCSVLVDGVFGQVTQRTAIAQCSTKPSTTFLGLWLQAQAEQQLARVGARHHDPSDATPEVVRAQWQRDTQPQDWALIDASGSAEQTIARALDLLSE